MTATEDQAALETFANAKTIAVVGLDTRTTRDAHRVAGFLQRSGYRIIPVPVQQPADEVLGEKAYPSLRDIPEHVDLVDVFVRSEHTDPIIDDAIAIGAGGIWLQFGIYNDAGLVRARNAGLTAIQDRCTAVELPRLRAQ